MPKRRTTKEYKKMVYNLVGNHYTVIGNYKNVRTPIKIKRNIKPYGIIKVYPRTFLRSHGYHHDAKYHLNSKYSNHKRTTAQYKSLVYHLVGNRYSVLGKYINCMTPIKMRINSEIPHTFYMTPNHFLNGERYRSIHNRATASMLFKQKVYKLTGNEYTVIGKYINQHTKILIQHNTKHPHLFLMTPSHFLQGERCPICFGTHKKSTNEFKSEVYKLVGDKFTVMGHYINNYTPIKMRHNTKHPHTFYIIPYSFLINPHCVLCDDRRRPWTTALFKFEVYKLTGNNYTVLGKYVNVHTPIKMRHNTKHPHTFYITPDAFINYGQRCVVCAMKNGESYGEYVINRYLQSIGFRLGVDYFYGYYMHTYSYCHKRLHADFYFPKYNTIIEFDGLQHERICNFFGGLKSLIMQRRRDALKDSYCFKHNIIMIRIKNYYKYTRNTESLAYHKIKYYIPLMKLIYSLN